MNPETERDIRIIYADSLPVNLLNRFISHLDALLDRNRNVLYPHTISEKTDNILEWTGTQYFSILHRSRPERVVFAGAIEKKERNRSVPAVRFFDVNPSLRNIPPQFLFPYHKENWTNVELTHDTIDLLPDLFDSQVRLFNERYISQ